MSERGANQLPKLREGGGVALTEHQGRRKARAKRNDGEERGGRWQGPYIYALYIYIIRIRICMCIYSYIYTGNITKSQDERRYACACALTPKRTPASAHTRVSKKCAEQRDGGRDRDAAERHRARLEIKRVGVYHSGRPKNQKRNRG